MGKKKSEEKDREFKSQMSRWPVYRTSLEDMTGQEKMLDFFGFFLNFFQLHMSIKCIVWNAILVRMPVFKKKSAVNTCR